MNIGIVTTWFERGAAYVSRQYKSLLEGDHQVFIYVRGETYVQGDPEWDLPEVTWGKDAHLPVPSAIDKSDFKCWLNQNKIQLVFFNEQQWWDPMIWCTEWGIRTGAYIDYYTETTIPLFAAYDFLICNTKRHFSAFDWHPQAFYVPWGTDIELFKPRQYPQVHPAGITFFQSCGFSPLRKGTDFVLRAFATLKDHARLLIHTQTDLQKALPELAETIDGLLKTGRLEIIQKTVKAPGLYHLGDVYLAPSRLEGIGLPVAEALSCGLPVVTVDNPPMNEFIDETSGQVAVVERLFARPDGYYWPQCRPSISSLADAMYYYIRHAAGIETFKRQARAHAVAKLNWEDRRPQVLKIFEQSEKLHKPKEIEQVIGTYEKRRSGLKLKIAERYPLVYKTIQRVSQIF